MDVHKPKPVRSWRELLTEIGIIVLSVCIALAAEQGVEWWHWKHRIADARAAVLLELRDDASPQAYTRIAMGNCLDRQLNALQDAIEAGRPRAAIIALIDDYKPPTRTWEMTAWNALLGSDVAAHVLPEQMILWSRPYINVPRLASIGEQERQDYIALRPTRRSGDKLSPGEADTMLAAVSRLRWDNRYMRGNSNGLLRAMKENGMEVTPEQQRRIIAGLKAHFQGCVVTPAIRFSDLNDNTSYLLRPAPAR